MKAKNILFTFIVVALFLFAGTNSVFAQTAGGGQRVVVGQNGQGDVLLGPLYNVLDGSYTTKITVINTDENNAVVAKVIFRSPSISAEALDFFIYLTPADVWDATITLDASGNAVIESTDDSCIAATGIWASETNPMREIFHTDKLLGDVNTFGHFEIIGVAAYGPIADQNLPLAKTTLYDMYFNDTGAPIDVPNVLAGRITLISNTRNQADDLNMTALADWNKTPFGNGVWTISTNNGLYNSTYNSNYEIDAALAKTEFSIPFDLSDSGDEMVLVLTTFPTKYFVQELGLVVPYFPCIRVDLVNTYKVWNMSEDKYEPLVSGPVEDICQEVIIRNLATDLIPEAINDDGFTKGWVKVTYFDTRTNDTTAGAAIRSAGGDQLDYAGVPMLNSYIRFSANQMSWIEAFSPESYVTYDDGTTLTLVRQ